MRRRGTTAIEDPEAPLSKRAGLPGLIGEPDFDRRELHGFEVDLDGSVLVPEFHPIRVLTSPIRDPKTGGESGLRDRLP